MAPPKVSYALRVLLALPCVCTDSCLARYEVIYTPSDIFVVMEYVPNGELFDYIVTKRKVGGQYQAVGPSTPPPQTAHTCTTWTPTHPCPHAHMARW